MRYITEIGLTSRFFQAKLAYQLVYHKNSGTLPLSWAENSWLLYFDKHACVLQLFILHRDTQKSHINLSF